MSSSAIAGIDRLVVAIERVAPEFIPSLRWLVFCPYAGSRLFPEGFCQEPTAADIHRVVGALGEDDGQKLQVIWRYVQTLEEREGEASLEERPSPFSHLLGMGQKLLRLVHFPRNQMSEDS